MNASFYFAECALTKAFSEDIVPNLLLASLQLGFCSLSGICEIFLTISGLLI